MRARGGDGRLGLFLALAASLLVAACARAPKPAPRLRDLVAALSEEGGYFDTDNLISNETSYAQIVEKLQPTGGVYVGVGPEQNFHYIGRLRPSWAFIVDVRRDNMLHHLLLNAVVSASPTPYDYLCRLFARRCGAAPPPDGSFEDVLAAFEAAEPDEETFRGNLAETFEHVESKLGFELTKEDRDVIEFISRSFFDEQLDLRFRSYGRPPMPYHPTYGRLLRAETSDGRPAHFLARPEDYAHVRGLATAGRLVPVVGDFAGEHALRAVGEFAEARGETVSAFYVSNVEFYLMRSDVFDRYVDNVRALPVNEDSLIIRAYFSYGYPHPATLSGHRSALVRQRVPRFLALYDEGAYHSYWDVSTLDYEE
jgi:hypothetical protein